MPISAQRNKKLETKAKTYAEKYERVGNELTISFVEENIPMSRQEIYSVFPALLDKQFKIHDDEIESRDALGKSVKCSLTRKVINTGNIDIISNFKMKLDARTVRPGTVNRPIAIAIMKMLRREKRSQSAHDHHSWSWKATRKRA
jgi:hypothetical protein